MVNFAKPLHEMSDEELWNGMQQWSPHFGSLASDELTRRGLKKLNESIDKNTKQAKKFADSATEFNRQTGEQSAEMIKMTRTMKALTWVMVVGLGIQIILAFKYDPVCGYSKIEGQPYVYDCITTIGAGPFSHTFLQTFESETEILFR